jgi:hypothetical protein
MSYHIAYVPHIKPKIAFAGNYRLVGGYHDDIEKNVVE